MNIKKISLISLFIALSVAGASIKIPAIVSSVALDMVPALLAGVILGGGSGAFVGISRSPFIRLFRRFAARTNAFGHSCRDGYTCLDVWNPL